MKNLLLNIDTIENEKKGKLSFFEANKDIPFSIERVYYIHDVPVNSKRGMHAHKNLQQLLWCPYGVIEITLDDGHKKEVYLLDTPSKGLLVSSGLWREMTWKKEGSVLSVVASAHYDEEDYIRDYEEFIRYVERGYWENED